MPGPAGAPGAIGPIGLTGATGAAGPTGAAGATGTAGPTGAVGPIGPAGTGPVMVSGVGANGDSTTVANLNVDIHGNPTTVTALPLSGYTPTAVLGTLVSGVFTYPEDSVFGGIVQTFPVPIAFTRIRATLVIKSAYFLYGDSVTPVITLFSYSAGSNSALTGATCTFLTQTNDIPAGTILTCTAATNFTASYNAGDAGFMVVSMSGTADFASPQDPLLASVSVSLSQ